MSTNFSSNFFSGNRAALRKQLTDDAPIIAIANGSLQRTSDTTFQFQQESSFWYLSGIEEADVILVIGKREEYLILPHTNMTKAIFNGRIDSVAASRTSGIQSILENKAGWEKLLTELKHTKRAYYLKPEVRYDQFSGVYANPAQRHIVDKLRRDVRGLELEDMRPALAAMRMRKQEPELRAIESAVNITTQTVAQVRTASLLAGIAFEYELEAAISAGFRRLGATGHAYAPIVASGGHATTLHYVANNGRFAQNQLAVVDVGAEAGHYAADITRTISATQPNARQAAVLEEVLLVQRRAVELLRPGILLREYEQTVARYMGESLRRLKLIANADDVRAIRAYFPHASSHFLGLDVHDVGDYDTPLEQNMVLTCEPGIYIPEENIGVRIEDDIVITANGNRNLSVDCGYSAYAL